MRSKVLLINMGHIWNVPPLFSISELLAKEGFDCELLGYQANDLPGFETLKSGVNVRRINLIARRIKFGPIRKVFALIEFIFKAIVHVRKTRPDAVILFNDPLYLIMPFISFVRKRVVWLLEYPEFERDTFLTSCVNRMSASLWHRGTMVVAPTSHRLAIHCTHNPAIQTLPLAVVENAPSLRFEMAAPSSEIVCKALEFIESCHARGLNVVVYAGGVSPRHGIIPLIEAVKCDERWALLIVGAYGDETIRQLIKECHRGDCINWGDAVPYAQLHHILRKCDLGYAYYVKDTLNQRFCAPGKLYDYLKNGLPVMTDVDSNIYTAVSLAGAGVFFNEWTKESVGKCLRAEIFSNKEAVDTAKQAAARLFEEELALEYRMKPIISHLS